MAGKSLNRREFITRSAAASLALGASSGTSSALGRPKDGLVRLGFVGLGSRGTGLLRVALGIEGVKVAALCDIDSAHLERARRLVENRTGEKPDGYSSGSDAYKKLCERDDLDAVVNATPMQLHTPVMVAAMEAGKYGATEVPAAVNLDQCWELVETSERTGAPCMMLENYCYFRNTMLVLNMARQGLFGELNHAEAGYQHDTRYVAFGPEGELLWRARYKMEHNGNLYPTHAVGPVAWWMDINRGDRFTYLVSMSSKPAGLNHYVARKWGPDHPNVKTKFTIGSINTSLIQTERGLTITLYYDTTLPRPFDMIYRIQGTEGIYHGTLDKIYIEGRSPEEHRWEDIAPYYGEFEHPLWKKYGEEARAGGHGGSDFMEMHQFIESVRAGAETPIDVYDAATWSVITPLSEQSVAGRSRAVEFPDFTRGKWRREREVKFLGI